jgi:hypothetical protein
MFQNGSVWLYRPKKPSSTSKPYLLATGAGPLNRKEGVAPESGFRGAATATCVASRKRPGHVATDFTLLEGYATKRELPRYALAVLLYAAGRLPVAWGSEPLSGLEHVRIIQGSWRPCYSEHCWVISWLRVPSSSLRAPSGLHATIRTVGSTPVNCGRNDDVVGKLERSSNHRPLTAVRTRRAPSCKRTEICWRGTSCRPAADAATSLLNRCRC